MKLIQCFQAFKIARYHFRRHQFRDVIYGCLCFDIFHTAAKGERKAKNFTFTDFGNANGMFMAQKARRLLPMIL